MRVNTERVIAAFRQGKAARFCRSIWTDGEAIYSYNTRMAWKQDVGESWLCLNTRRYSNTTSRHQAGLRTAFPSATMVNGTTIEQGEYADKLDREIAEETARRNAERKAARAAARKELRAAVKASAEAHIAVEWKDMELREVIEKVTPILPASEKIWHTV